MSAPPAAVVSLPVLLVEDEPITCEIVAASLARAPLVRPGDAPFALAVVDTLAAARARLAAGDVAAVLLDLSLPDSEGLETFRALRDAAPGVPVVIITATDDEALALTAVREGAHDWVVKGSRDPALLPRVLRHAIERRRAEQALAESAEALRSARQLAAVGRLAGGMAHALNNMLTIVRCSAELLRDQLEDERQRDDVAGMLDAAQRATALVRQLLAFGSRQVLRPVAVDPAVLVLAMMPTLVRTIGDAWTLTLDAAPGGPQVKVDPAQFEQVILQLVLDARDAQPAGGRIALAVGTVDVAQPEPHAHGVVAPGRYVSITVADDAPLAADAVDALFEPFFARSGAERDGSLGLAVPFGIVRQSGGQLRVRGIAPGTTLEVLLPTLPAVVRPPAPVASEGGFAGHDQRLLVVEDDARIRELIIRVLSRQGWEVREAPGGAEALALLEGCDGGVDLVVTDLSMPGMGGKALVDHVRARWPGMRVLFMSGYADEEATREAMGGDVPFLGKPFTSVELSRAVREAWLADPMPWPAVAAPPAGETP